MESLTFMKDKFNREIDYLRISVTENCNLRCVYCTEEDLIHSKDFLSSDEIYEIVKECAKLGIKKIRFTGGEPLFRKDILDIFEKINRVESIEEKYITTNGIYLSENLDKLKEFGLTGVNISIDSLREERFNKLTKSNNLKRVLESVDKSLNLGIKVKINVVLIKGINDDEIIDFVNLTKDKKIDVRFIELMPIGLGKKYIGISNENVREIINENFDIEVVDKEKRSGPASYIKIKNYKKELNTVLNKKDYEGKIGFISAMSDCFCEECNRIRLTSTGFLKKCLHYNYGVNLKEFLDKQKEINYQKNNNKKCEEFNSNNLKNNSNEELRNLIEKTIYDKPEKHLFNVECIDKEDKLMNQIGG